MSLHYYSIWTPSGNLQRDIAEAVAVLLDQHHPQHHPVIGGLADTGR